MRGGHRGVRALSCTRTLRARGMIHLGRTVGAGGRGEISPNTQGINNRQRHFTVTNCVTLLLLTFGHIIHQKNHEFMQN